MEQFTKWEPLSGVSTWCFEINFRTDRTGDFEVMLRFANTKEPGLPSLHLNFGPNVLAFTSYEEFVHPWVSNEVGPIPRLPEPYLNWPFPLLIVHDSLWFASVVDDEIYKRSAFTHYRLVSLDNIVDVVSSGEVTARWEPVSETP